MATIFVLFYFFFCSGMLINTVPDDCLVYIGFNWVLIFNITSIVNVFMLSIKKKAIEGLVSVSTKNSWVLNDRK